MATDKLFMNYERFCTSVMSFTLCCLLLKIKCLTDFSLDICVACLYNSVYNSAYGVFTLDRLIVFEQLLLVATTVLQN